MARIAVIGVGPRGLSALERVISHAQLVGPPIELVLIEPGDLGVGVHRIEQPDFLLLNTIASQLTIFSDEEMTPGKPVTTGHSLYDWCRGQQLPVRFDEYLPRRVLGEYLQWAVGNLLERVPDRLSVRHVHTYATGLHEDGDQASVELADGTTLRVDLAIVTTGHGLAAPAHATSTNLITDPYPLPDQVDHIPDDATVALIGTGLTAMDVIAALTVGRGGRFQGGRYLTSGREPRIVLANRSGQLPCARPATTTDRRSAPARHLTLEAVDELRRSALGGRLDFRRDIEPLIRREVLDRMVGATDAELAAVDRVFRPGTDRWPGYADFVADQLDAARADLGEAERGLGVSLVKEGLECLRDHRAGLRAALDPPGLTEESHRYFMTEYAPLVNRAVIGPQKERTQELLILIEAGIVIPGPGPRPDLVRTETGWLLRSSCLGEPFELTADVLVKANLNWPVSVPGRDPIGDAIRASAVPGPGGEPWLGLDRNGYPIMRVAGTGRRAVAVFGPPAEGASYYNHYVPSPGVLSRILTDLDRVLEPVLEGHSPELINTTTPQ